MAANHEVGTFLEIAPADWQIIQQQDDGCADIPLTGHWRAPEDASRPTVWVRLMTEDRNEAVTSHLDWDKATTRKDGSWSAKIRNVPAGGLYRLETCLQIDGCQIEWARHGEMRHHIGVGDNWLITGQSNAVGYGKSPAYDPPELGIHMFAADGRWKLATHPLGDFTGTLYPANSEAANASHSPWITFARRIRSEVGYPIGLIPAALGGSAISAWDRSVDGHLFTNMLGYLTGAGSGVRGVLWYQGESDVAPEPRSQYRERFANVLHDLRRVTGRKDLPILTVQLNRFVGENAEAVSSDWEAMRELQRSIAADTEGVTITSVFDAGLSDLIHNGSDGNLIIGERVAKAALGAVYGLPVPWRQPECCGARRLSAKRVALQFENVVGRIHYSSVVLPERAFAVRDTAGEVPIEGWTADRSDRIVLDLARPLEGQATVTGAPTANPPHPLPIDVPGYRPILGFTVPVDS